MTRNQNHIRKTGAMALLALAFLACLPARAADPETERWYQVEIIIFMRPDASSQGNEVWPENPVTGDSGQSIRLKVPAPGAKPAASALNAYEILPPEQMKLAAQEQKLERAGYRPLLHLAWRQPTVAPEQTRAVYIDDFVFRPDAPGSNQTTGNPLLSGTIKLGVSRYLHLAVDMVYRMTREEDVLVQAPAEISPPSFGFGFGDNSNKFHVPEPYYEKRLVTRGYRLAESRRMRSDEIHYLDHPILGIVAQITPVESGKGNTLAPAPSGSPSIINRIAPAAPIRNDSQ